MPGPAASKRPVGADDSFGDAEEHGITRIADGQHAFSLSHRGGLGKRKMRDAVAGRFCQSNIKVAVDTHNFGFQLSAVRQAREQSFLAARQMGVCGDNAGSSNKKARATFREAF